MKSSKFTIRGKSFEIKPCLLSFCLASLLVGSLSCGEEVTKKPNILFAIADDASFPHTSISGCQWVQTPAFDRVARSGIHFVNTYTPNAKCSPSRACILTGRNSWQLEAATNHIPYFPDKFGTYMEALEAAGYHVGHTAKGWAPGKVGSVDGVQRKLTGTAYNDATLTPPTSAISANDYSANFNAFLADRDPSQPFCFWYGSLEPHRRYEFGTGVSVAGKDLSEVDDIMSFYPDNDTIRHDLLDYALEIEHFDQHLGRMLEKLEEIGELENTLVIVTADNGMPFPRIKGQTYELSNHLPLAVMWPAGIKNPGREVADLVSFIDFAPTILEISQVDPALGKMESITGKSLTPFFEGAEPVDDWRSFVLMGKERHDIGRPNDEGYPTRAILQGELLLIKNFEVDRWPAGNPETGYLNTDGSPTKTWILQDRRERGTSHYWDLSFGKRPAYELYNIKVDPYCMENLASESRYAQFIEDADARLMETLAGEGDPRALGQGHVFDEYPYANESQQSFFERFQAGELSPSNAGWVNASDFETEPVQ